MTNLEQKQLAEIIRNVVNGFEEIRKELVGLGGNPVNLDLATRALRESEYTLLANRSGDSDDGA